MRAERNVSLSALGVALAVALLVPTAGSAEAAGDGSFQCENQWRVKVGDHITNVVKNCGEPDHTNRRTDVRKVKRKVRRWLSPVDSIEEEHVEEVEVQVDELVYEFGPNRFTQFCRFENGNLVHIRQRWNPGSR
jgi:hypothetical protein